MLHSALIFAAALVAAPVAQASALQQGSGRCKDNACLRAVVGKNQKPCVAECKSFLKITVTPTASNVVKTVTAYVTTNSQVPVTAKVTTLVTVTQTQSEVETDVESATATETNYETATATDYVTTTVTTGELPDHGPFKRAISTKNPFLCVDLDEFEPEAKQEDKRAVLVKAPAGPVTHRPTKIPATATACANSAAFSSACSCIGVTARTSTACRPTTTSTFTKTITRAKPVTTTKTTVTITSVVKTQTQTTTYSTSTTTKTVATAEVDITDATQTVTSTSTVEVPPNPVQTVYLRVIGSADPAISVLGGVGFPELESFRGSTSVYYFDFTNNVVSDLMVGINILDGKVTMINGPGEAPGKALYYSTFGGLAPASYVNAAPEDFAVSQGGMAAVCKIAQTGLYEQLQCKWGDNQIADFWTCKGRLNLVRPGFDFSHACVDASTTYKIPMIQVIRL